MKQSIYDDPTSKRNFYFKLFQIFNEMSVDECLNSFTKIYNDVFVFEKPLVVQRYFLSEVRITEIYETKD
jgi:hypothetical protein